MATNDSKSNEASNNAAVISDKATAKNLARKPVDLRELMLETVEAPTNVIHHTPEEYAEIDARREKLGRGLADKLYELTNVTRETNLTTYIETINDVVLETESEENQAILAIARSYFVEAYGAKIRSLGHSPLVLDQIVHRTGRETRDIVAQTLQGFDVKLISAQIREKARTFSNDTAKATARLMYDLTHQQVRELRETYTTLPGKEIAALLYHSLTRTDLKGKPFPDADTIRYILLYRSSQEVAQIECQYNEVYHFDRTQNSELCLREQIRANFSPEQASELLNLLEGFQPAIFADSIYELISNYSILTEGLEYPTNLHNDFAGLFRHKNRNIPIWQKEIAARTAIENVISDLSCHQFKQVCDVLRQRYDIQLTPELYPSVREFNPRDIALDLYQSCLSSDPRAEFRRSEQYLTEKELHEVKDEFRLSRDNELSEIIRAKADEKKSLESLAKCAQALVPISFLTPEQLRLVSFAFKQVTGTAMAGFVKDTVAEICRNEIPKYVDDFVFLILTATGRQKLDTDIFAIFSNKDKREQEATAEKSRQKMIAQIPAITSILEQENEAVGSSLFHLLSQYPLADLHTLEKLFVEKKDSSVPFLKSIEISFSAEDILTLELLFKGINVDTLIDEIHQDVSILTQHLRLRPEYIQLINSKFHAMYIAHLVY